MREDDAVSERPTTLLDALVDLTVYAPVGLALTAAEELPELIAKGRARVEPQLGAARLVGQFVVAEGRRRVITYCGFGGAGVRTRPTDRSTPDAGAGPGPDTGASEASASGEPPAPAKASRAKKAASKSPARPAATDDVPDVASLAIPGYDSLSASQVVQRLAGLSPGELAAVGRYETATRGRRTILARVAQLQGD